MPELKVDGHSIYALGDAAAWPIQRLIRQEIERRIVARGGDLAPMMEAAE